MDGGRQRTQTLHQRGRWSIQKFVSNAENAILFHGLHLFPAPVTNDFFQRNPVARATPRGDDHIRILGQNILG
jgi:hypothetical protein